MEATINGSGTIIKGKTLQDIRRKMCAMLSIDGLLGITATTERGTIIHVELFEDQDYIITPQRRYLSLPSRTPQ